MPDFRLINSLSEVSPADWDRVLGSDYPFQRHAFLSALEQTGAADAASGWQPRHLLIEEQGRLIGHLPLYLKFHSYGEFVFDWGWAGAYERNGYQYYPKLLSAIPYTPATGPRLLLEPGCDRSVVMPALVDFLKERVADEASTLHILFPEQEESQAWVKAGLALRTAVHFQWRNQGFKHFDDFLDSFNSRKRKNLRKERRRIAEQGLSVRRVAGSDIDDSLWRKFYHCYQLTYAKRSGHGGYLPRSFFTRLGECMPEQLLMVVAERNGEFVAAALNFRDSTSLYGRYWGCLQEFEFLHFETCYYQGIEYCIEQGLECFDPGVQGEHKIQRGFRPTFTYSVHWVRDPSFRQAVDRFLVAERDSVASYAQAAEALLPFKSSSDSSC